MPWRASPIARSVTAPISSRCPTSNVLVASALFPLAARFVAGETVDAAIAALRRLHDDGFSTTLDMLGEDVADRDAARRVRNGYLALIDRLAASGVETNLSLKLSALGLTFDPDDAHASFEAILAHARAQLADPFVRIDMEGFDLLEPTLAFFESTWTGHRNTGPVLQAYLHRTPADVARMIALGARVRLCKGAYRASTDVALRRHDAIQSQFMACAVHLLRDGTYPAIATHDPELIAAIRAILPAIGRAQHEFEFQMLYGVNPALQRELVAAGYRVRVYVPFGSQWARYFRRRMFERRENFIFAMRSIAGRATI
jgi:proline dehydrogenase